MPACQTNTNYIMFTDAGVRVRKTELSADGKTLLVKTVPGGVTECTWSIDSSSFTGLETTANGLKIIVGAISGLTNTETIPVNKNPDVNVEQSSGALEIVGYEDLVAKLDGPKVNVRYNAASDEVRFEY